jgi:hypothetical protein
MDPATIILTALAAGVADAVKDVASEEIPKAYQALKKLVVNKLQSGANMKEEAAATLVNEYEQDPESWEGGLKSKLKQAPLNEQDEIVRQAQALLDLIKQSQPTVAESGRIEVGEGAQVEGLEAKTGDVETSSPTDRTASGDIKIGGSSTIKGGNFKSGNVKHNSGE